MPRTLHTNISRRSYGRRFIPVYTATLLIIFHAFLVAYINSSYLQQFVDDASIGTIYTVASALTVLIFLFVSRVLHKVGNYKLSLLLVMLNMFAVLGMAYAESLRTAVPLFIIHILTVPLIIFNLDVFMEALIGDEEQSTGSRRGLILTLSSLIGAVAPFLGSVLIDLSGGSFSSLYLVSAGALLPVLFILMAFFSNFSDPPYNEIKVLSAIRSFWVHRNVRYVFLAHFSLQIFFMFMVVYSPIYLTDHIGLSWSEFGIVMFFAQLAYVFLEYPSGIVADKYLGEKEMMSVGFLIIALATASMSFIVSASVVVWALIMFVTRVGASFAEVTTESYFFKQVDGSNAQIISFFRVTRPLSYIFGALMGSLALLYLPYNLIFVVLALMMVPSIFFIANLVDTK